MRKNSHLAYFVLPTSVVNDYVKADVNRYLLLIEALMLQVTSRPDSPAVSQGQQLVNGIMLSALLRTIRLAYGNTNPKGIQRCGSTNGRSNPRLTKVIRGPPNLVLDILRASKGEDACGSHEN